MNNYKENVRLIVERVKKDNPGMTNEEVKSTSFNEASCLHANTDEGLEELSDFIAELVANYCQC